MLLFVSCQNREEIDVVVDGNDNVFLNFAVEDNLISKATGYSDDSETERKITHLDFFIYKITNLESKTDELYYYARIMTDGSSGQGNAVLPNLKLSDLKNNGSNYKICIIANSARPETDFKENGIFNTQADTYGELSALIETTQYVNITGSNIFKDANGNDIAPQTFLMTGSVKYATENASINKTHSNYGAYVDLTSCSDSDLNLSTTLERAAAKITFNFTIKDGSNHIHSFGNPTDATKEDNIIDLNTINDRNYSESSYYLRNMTYESTYFGDYSNMKRKTNPVPYTDGGYMTCTHNTITVTAYVYSCSWGGNQADAFTNTPFLIVNLPLVEITDKANNKGVYLNRTYYEIPLRIRDDNETVTIERNHHYVLNATIDAAGGITSMEPFPIVPVSYWVYPWNSEEIEVGSNEAETVKYLNLSTDYIEMHNTTTDASIKFASSSAVTVTLKEAYYIDKFGIKKTITENTGSAVSSVGMNGHITVTSDLPTNNAAKYMVFEVSNGDDAYDKEFTVVQYPLLYIFNTLGYFSYRDDVKNNEKITHLLNRQSSVDDNTTVYTDQWGNEAFGFRIAKAPNSSGASGIYNYVASRLPWLAFGGEYLGWALRSWLVSGGSATYELDNGRMYHIIISSTSKDYVLGKPTLDANGYTVADEHNAKMVSPSFMIASQLGTLKSYDGLGVTSGSTGYIDGNEYYREAQKHCKNYVETYIVNDDGDNQLETGRGETLVELRGWRLPTAKEIDIIIQRQTASDAMDVLLVGEKYFCASPEKFKESGYKGSGNTDFTGYWTRCVRDAYDDATPKH